ncbi:MAG: M81 family metallopeptidase [Salinisphaera sp.]|nr:M81 family metallopeptidase [Salinisphaera sp.]
MRFVIARINHETNTFSPLPTPLESFAPRWGDDALQAGEGSQVAMGAFLAYAKASGAEIITPVFAMANPSGLVADAAFEAMTQAVVDAVGEGCDAIFLDLHGAMVTETIDDGEGELLSRVRDAAPKVPIGVALDLHGNITARMLDSADVIVGFKTYPHVDMYETGEHVVRLVAEMLEGDFKPARALAHPPLLAHTLKMNTTVPGAMAEAIDAAKQAESRSGVRAVTVFGGFPIADIAETGISILVVADTPAVAEAVAKELAGDIWLARDGFIYRESPLADSVAVAAQACQAPGDGPVLMLDHGDNCMSGGTCDIMDVLAEAIHQNLRNILVGPIADRAAVAAMQQAGIGATITLGVGNRWAMPGTGAVDKRPLELTGKVRTLGRGKYAISGPTYTGMQCDMGEGAVLETDHGFVFVVEEPHEPWDFGVFDCVDLDPRASRFLILKSRMYCRPVFEPIAKSVVECASLGVTSSNFDIFAFEKLTRPIFPLDEEFTWTPTARLSLR